MEELWHPSAEQAAATHMAAFMRRVGERRALEFGDYAALYAWSILHPEQFWADLWEYADVACAQPYTAVVDDPRGSFSNPRWAAGSQRRAPDLPRRGSEGILATGRGHPKASRDARAAASETFRSFRWSATPPISFLPRSGGASSTARLG